MEPQHPEREETTPDLVGRTSARLLAAGVDRRERLAALHLLAVLDASVDVNGRVRRPLDDLADEFDLSPLSALRSMEHLQQAGAVRREGSAVVLLGANPEGLGGMQLADFLDDVRASFDGERAALDQPARRPAWLARGGAVLAVAAGVLAIATIAPSRPATQQQPPLAASATSAAAAAPSSTSTSADLAPATTAAPVETPTTAAAATPAPEPAVLAATTCPTSSPVAEFIDRVIRITNPTTEDIVITEVLVGALRIVTPIAVRAGATVERPVATLSDVEPQILQWEWTDGTVARTLPFVSSSAGDALVWYAAYGSNTDASRFREYLAGCREPVEPVDDRAVVLDLPLYFAGTTSGRWGDGGVAFARVQPRDERPSTLGRAWLLPVVRVAEVGAQENGLPLDRAALDLDAGDHRPFADRWYDTWVRCGELDGVPMVTLTASVDRAPRTPPSRAYAVVVARGIRSTHGMTREEVAAYLTDRTNLPFTTLMEWQAGGEG